VTRARQRTKYEFSDADALLVAEYASASTAFPSPSNSPQHVSD
jgi:hypothetical protein